MGVDQLISTLLSDSVSYIINVATSLENAMEAVAQAKRYANMYTALGVHPSDTRFIDREMSGYLCELEAQILSSENKCVALGEIGLDYHYEDTDKLTQAKWFEAQMALAEKLSLPVVIHDREAHGDCLEMIKNFPKVRGVLHSFSGSTQMAEELIMRGYVISFSGTLTFTNAKKPKEVAKNIPLSHIMIETDAPYLAPHPFRGRLNHSGYLEYTNRTLAELHNISEEECCNITNENARRFFSL